MDIHTSENLMFEGVCDIFIGDDIDLDKGQKVSPEIRHLMQINMARHACTNHKACPEHETTVIYISAC